MLHICCPYTHHWDLFWHEVDFSKCCGGFYIWKCHLDGISSISVSGFMSNTGDVELNLWKLQKLVYHEIFLDIRHQVCPHDPCPKSILPQPRPPTKSQKYERERLRSCTQVSLSFLICSLEKQRLTRKWNQSSVSFCPFLSFRQWLNFPVACTKPVPTGALA